MQKLQLKKTMSLIFFILIEGKLYTHFCDIFLKLLDDKNEKHVKWKTLLIDENEK